MIPILLVDANTSNLGPIPEVTKAVTEAVTGAVTETAGATGAVGTTGVTGVTVNSIVSATIEATAPVVTKGVNYNTWLWWLFAIVVILLIIYFLVRHRTNKK